MYRVRQKGSPYDFFCSFFSNRLGFSGEILPSYLVILCAHNRVISIQLVYCVLMLLALQRCHLVILPCSKTFVQKPIPENRMQNGMSNSCLDFITTEMLPFNSPELNPLDNHIWGNVRGQSHAPSKTEDIAELKEMLQMTV